MKIYVNRRPVSGPWGGGSKILRAIVDELLRRGHEVLFEEQHATSDRVDLILCVDPRPTHLVRYEDLVELKIRSKCKIVQRVGDLGTHGKPDLFKLVSDTVVLADRVVFPSVWARDYLGFGHDKSVVIPNGADPRFKEHRRETNSTQNVLSIVTHHWSDNVMKGFETYEQLSSLCSSTPDIRFTYIGRAPASTHLTKLLQPMNVVELSYELPRHDVYVTASRKEAGANHVLEAMAAGLPVLYHEDGGSIVEYCKTRGNSYRDFDDLRMLLMSRQTVLENMSNTTRYDRTTIDVGKEYVDHLESINEGKC